MSTASLTTTGTGPNGWRKVRLDAIGTIVTGSTPPTHDRTYYEGRWMFVSPADLGQSKYVRTTAKRLSRSGLARSRSIPAGSTLFVCIGSTIGKVGLTIEELATNQQINSIIPGAEIDTEYLYYAAKTLSSVIRDRAGEQAVPLVNKSEFSAFEILLPQLDEQRRIASSLRDVDDLIAALERKIAKKQAIKQGMMQQLLTGKTRLPGFTEPWARSTVGALARVTGGGTPSTRVSAYWGGGIPWFTPAEIKANGSGLVACSERTITQEGLASSAATLLPAGSVLVTSRASIGNCAVAEVPVTTNQGFTSMIPKDRRSSWFLYYWVQQNRSEFESRSAGSTFLEISVSKAASIPLGQPSLDEQQAIGEVLRDTDMELDAQKQRLVKARAIKTGMMQQLLAGRTRLPVEATS